jgi:hypothetical protein
LEVDPMKNWHYTISAMAAIAVFGLGRTAHAQTTVVATSPPPVAPAASEQVRYVAPNVPMIASGVATFAIGYVPSVIVAAESPLPADRHLYIPIAGPWIDMADRPACGVGWIGCGKETGNKVLLGLDGVVQAIGVLATATGFLVPERTVVVTAQADKPSLHLTPAQFTGGAYGVAAFGNF